MVELRTHTEICLQYAKKTELTAFNIATAAVTGDALIPGDRFRWETLVRVGIHPLLKERILTACPYTGSRGSHPILLAAALQDSEPFLAREFVERAADDGVYYSTPRKKDETLKWYHGAQTFGGSLTKQTYRPEPPKIEARCSSAPEPLFAASHAAWYTPEALNSAMERSMASYTAASLLEKLSRAIGNDPAGILRIKNLATKFLRREITSSARARPQAYRDLAQCARFCHQEDIAKALEGAGSYRLLLAFLKDPTEEQMSKGLQQIATSWSAGLSLLPRAPTVNELRKLSGAAVQTVLHDLPWELLEQLLTADKEGVRGLLIKKIDDLDYMRECIAPYDNRPKWNSQIHTGEERLEWEPYKEKISKGFASGRAYREAIGLLDMDQEPAIHLLLAHWTGWKHHAPAFEWLKVYPDLEPVLLSYPPPFTPERPLYAGASFNVTLDT